MLQGHQTWIFPNKPVILSSAAAGGPDEAKGPLANDFDILHDDMLAGQKSWEKAEKILLEQSCERAIEKAGITKEKINFMLAGDLMNQIISSSYGARTLTIPYLGMFGACSTSMQSLALASLLVDTQSEITHLPPRAVTMRRQKSNIDILQSMARKNRQVLNGLRLLLARALLRETAAVPPPRRVTRYM
jgi:hypothetical protein